MFTNYDQTQNFAARIDAGLIGEQVAKSGCSSASEYIRYWICQELERVAKIKLERLLLEGLDSGKPIEVSDEW